MGSTTYHLIHESHSGNNHHIPLFTFHNNKTPFSSLILLPSSISNSSTYLRLITHSSRPNTLPILKSSTSTTTSSYRNLKFRGEEGIAMDQRILGHVGGYHMVSAAADVALFRNAAAVEDVMSDEEEGSDSDREEGKEGDDDDDNKYWSE